MPLTLDPQGGKCLKKALGCPIPATAYTGSVNGSGKRGKRSPSARRRQPSGANCIVVTAGISVESTGSGG
ncbi:hypothetical protein HORIV_27000 [Vreelandella olivaria]|uniref:Uncharacterized protein n=1 Tax=Vreelandella olivaria TaxID=390919 RepID=A0ABM7GI53_9GAMM|nr:hypothetical protein HORIV_27000 [Halomonas olivaria]